MVKKTKSVTQKKVEQVVVEPEVVVQEVVAPEVVAPEVVELNVDETSDVNDDSSLAFTMALKECYDMNNDLKVLQTKQLVEIKKLEKIFKKQQKDFNKRATNKKNKPKRQPSGFAKPTPISKELCSFLQRPPGTEMARTEVTKYLTNYIKENGLQFQEDRRKIVPDVKLTKLLNLKKDDQVTYFNLQRYMKPHFESAKNTISV